MDRWADAIRHLREADPYLCAIIDRVGPCLLEPRPDRFGTLVRAIIGQQISSKAAASIEAGWWRSAASRTAPALLALGEAALRGVGLSGVKARYVLNLAEAVASGAVPLDAIDESWTDAEVVAALVSIKGIGVWTAEMFLIFSLGRPDVLPVGDLGVRVGAPRPARPRRAAAARRLPCAGRDLAAVPDRSRAGTSGGPSTRPARRPPPLPSPLNRHLLHLPGHGGRAEATHPRSDRGP